VGRSLSTVMWLLMTWRWASQAKYFGRGNPSLINGDTNTLLHKWSDIKNVVVVPLEYRAEIHQALLSQFSLLTEFFIVKVLVKQRYSRVLMLVNLNPEIYFVVQGDRKTTNRLEQKKLGNCVFQFSISTN
jgi:hypothetical protein